jgi:hypothetical protein
VLSWFALPLVESLEHSQSRIHIQRSTRYRIRK